MELLLHTCCAPCAIYPISVLKDEGFNITLYFYNPNIHPYQEFKRRLDCVSLFCEKKNLSLIADEAYRMNDFLRAVVFQEHHRCQICSSLRMTQTCNLAKNKGFDSFSTTLLYSKYQHHSEIKYLCQVLSKDTGLPFYYKDFREGWQSGIDSSREQGLYRQSYCGCIYSEQQRYDKFMRSERK